jgi:hypothetical protein
MTGKVEKVKKCVAHTQEMDEGQTKVG